MCNRVQLQKRALSLFYGLTAALFMAQSALPYQKAGHFYSLYAVATASSALNANERRLLAFCAQLPDQSSDLDAVVVYKTVLLNHPIDWFQWASLNRVMPNAIDVQRMISVQQLLHVLTGGNASDVKTLAEEVVTDLSAQVDIGPDRNVAICALGFAFHMMGDSYAHQQMDGDPLSMYPTGRGHAAHLSYPDYPLCDAFARDVHATQTCLKPNPSACGSSATRQSSRFCRWREYPLVGASLVSDKPDLSMVQTLSKALGQLSDQASDLNQWGESLAEENLLKDENLSPEFGQFFEKHASSETCQVVMSAAERELGITASVGNRKSPSPPLSCSAVWASFSAVMIKIINVEEANGKHIRQRVGTLSWNDLYVSPIQ